MELIVQKFQYERATKFKWDIYLSMEVYSRSDFNRKFKSCSWNSYKEKILEKQIDKIISQFEFDPLLKIKTKHLSGGQKKELVISMALINDPSMYF